MTLASATGWIARGLSHLYEQEDQEKHLLYDVVIVGTGYGGAMAAAELSGMQDGKGNRKHVLVLERGKEYVPGMFPSSGHEMPPQVRVHRCQSGETTGRLDGLFDVRIGPDVCALVANGLGGGSLINAGVMEIPDWKAVPRMPAGIVADLTKKGYMEALKERLGAAIPDPNAPAGGPGWKDNTIFDHQLTPNGTNKTKALQSLAGAYVFRKAAITIETQQNAALERCTLCGDCMTGCNVGAKKSLDTNLLLEAWKKGAQIHTGASVTALRGLEKGGWELTVVFTDESLRKRHIPLKVRAAHVIVAAGALGSPELLMRSETALLRFSPRLGQQFSCNGDNIVAIQNPPDAKGAPTPPTRTVAREWEPLDTRDVGPTITGVIDVRSPSDPAKPATGPGFMVQEFAVPAPLKRVFDEIVTTSGLLHRLAVMDKKQHFAKVDGDIDPLAVNAEAMDKVLLVGLIGHDESSGELTLAAQAKMDDSRAVEGRIRIEWPDGKKSYLQDRAFGLLEKLAASRTGVTVLPNPMWRMLPQGLDFVFRSERGPLLTVHPLGGCPMGPDGNQGAVDEFGRVFDAGPNAASDGLHRGLRVLDGSIIPASLGANPGLTIAAVAQRAARELARTAGWTPVAYGAPYVLGQRPRARDLRSCVAEHKPRQSAIELIERLRGPVRVGGKDYVVELTLHYVPRALGSLARNMRRVLALRAPSVLRVYSKETWEDKGVRFLEEKLRKGHALAEAPLTGTLAFLAREPSRWYWRVARGFVAYLRNRGLRDFFADVRTSISQLNQVCRLLALASRAGEARLYEYDLEIGQLTKGDKTEFAGLMRDKIIKGGKRFTYSMLGNPWRQLMELKLTDFLGLSCATTPVLELDGRFMARHGVPLARIVRQQNQIVALAEMASFSLYLLRLFISIHVWSFRAPDVMPARKRSLLPENFKGSTAMEQYEFELEPPRHGIPVRMRLSRYPQAGGSKHPPLVMIHGYSTSGNAFTHKAIPEPMAHYFWKKGRDVWIVDLRTSSGMPSALLPWNFEDVALADIPFAIAKICEVSGEPKVDVFAHCIGAVMFSMALLTEPQDAVQMAQIEDVEPSDGYKPKRYLKEVQELPDRIRRIVLSQKGPALVYSDGNVLRAYLMRVLRRLVLPQNYQFRAPAHQSLAGQALDRLLSSMPYPDRELARENPLWPWAKNPWVGYRHRMDALYARDFTLANMKNKTLRAIDDLFGPMNLDTIAQAAHFARYNKITNGAGRNCFVTVQRVSDRWPKGRTLSIHASDNGLADVRTLDEMRDLMNAAGLGACFFTERLEGLGHQDCLIGKTAEAKVFKPVERFLSLP